MVVTTSTPIFSLPNEILSTIFSHHSTPTLLTIAPTSRHIYNLILKIVHQRILSASALQSHQIIFECYNPALRLGTPHMLCTPLTTSTLATPTATNTNDDGLSFSSLNTLYTVLKPTNPKKQPDQPRPHPAGGLLAPVTAIFPALQQDATPSTSMLSERPKSKMDDLVTQRIHLESHELFTQLCSNIKIVKPGPRQGVYRSCVFVGEGILRIWRHWLSSHAADCDKCDKSPGKSDSYDEDKKASDGRILWIDTQRNFGLRMRVEKDLDVIAAPAQTTRGRVDEDEDVGYILGYEELIIRSSQLLLKVEASTEQEKKNSGSLLNLNANRIDQYSIYGRRNWEDNWSNQAAWAVAHTEYASSKG